MVHAKRVVGAIRGYYEHMNELIPGVSLGVEFTSTLRGVTRELRK